MATHIKLSSLERRILDRVFDSVRGFERVEDIHAELGADDHDFVDALENLEGEGWLAVRRIGSTIVIGVDDPLHLLGANATPGWESAEIGVC